MSLVIRWTVLAQQFVAHLMVIARALPDMPVPPKTLILNVVTDPLDPSGSNLCCASDGDSEGPPR
eukprot:8197411-Heterocapsa_arctica.AAC.1